VAGAFTPRARRSRLASGHQSGDILAVAKVDEHAGQDGQHQDGRADWHAQRGQHPGSPNRGEGGGGKGPGGRDAGHRHGQQPGRAGKKAKGPGGGQQQSEEGRDALAAPEAEPDREQVAEEGEAAGDRGHGLGIEQGAGDQQGRGPLSGVEQ